MTSRMLSFVLSTICFTFAAFSQAQVLAPTQQLYVTIYNNNLALVEDKRTLDLPQGYSKIEFKGVSASIRPETVSLLTRPLQRVPYLPERKILSVSYPL